MTAHRLSVRLFPPQAERLDALAQARGMTRSELLRTLVLEATVPAAAASVPDTDELLRLLGLAARMGNVPAMRELLAHHRRALAAPSPLEVVDELAERRAAAGGPT